MRERPMLFNGPMVRAILDGRKTQTRRAVKPVRGYEQYRICRPDGAAAPWSVWWHADYETVGVMQDCPYGRPGDRLWVRETTEVDRHTSASVDLARYSADRLPVCHPQGTGSGYDGAIQHWWYSRDTCPNIHMPRSACRMVLEITAVRVERLQAISRVDCIAEGAAGGHGSIPGYGYSAAPHEHFEHVWTSTGGDWAANPWVWAISFRRMDDGGK